MLRPTVSIMSGLIAAFLTWFMIGDHREYVHPHGPLLAHWGWVVIILVMPGLLAAIILSGNVHLFEMWPAALVNFLFYFVLIYAVFTVRQRRRVARHANP